MADPIPMQLLEYPGPREFAARAGPWLVAREAENSHFLGVLPQITPVPRGVSAAFYGLLDQRTQTLAAAAILFGNGCLFVSPIESQYQHVLISEILRLGLNVKSVYGPACLDFAALWAGQTAQSFTCARAELLYQLTRVATPAPPSGHLARAGVSDRSLIASWLQAFSREANLAHPDPAGLAASLIAAGELYLWKNPEPVSMAAWVAPTPHGGTINLVYTPPELRSRGHGTAMVAALADHMLGSGLHFCILLADPSNRQTDGLYRKVGFRPLCEMQRCPFTAVESFAPAAAG